MIETHLLRALSVFYTEGTLLKTSKKLNVSQPALTRSMQKLEEELGVKIFNRTKNKITLNELGIKAAQESTKILEAQEQMIEDLRRMEEQNRRINFGSIAPAPVFELNPVIKELYPGIQISSEIKTTEEELFAGLEKGTYDFVISRRPLEDEEHLSKEYFRESLKIFLPTGHPLADRKSIYLKDLAGETFLMLSELGFWAEIKKKKIPGAKFITQQEAESLKDLVASSTLPTFVTDVAQNSRNYPTYTQKDRVAVPILDPEVNVTFYLVLKKSDSEKLQKLIDEVKPM